MRAHITSYHNDGTAATVETDDGFALMHGPYDPNEHGWIEGQLDKRDYSLINAGRQMERLVDQVNSLKRENWRLEQQLKQWMKAAGF